METDGIKLFLTNMVAKGKITQIEADEKILKHEAKETAKAKYKAEKSKLTKADLQKLLDTLTS